MKNLTIKSFNITNNKNFKITIIIFLFFFWQYNNFSNQHVIILTATNSAHTIGLTSVMTSHHLIDYDVTQKAGDEGRGGHGRRDFPVSVLPVRSGQLPTRVSVLQKQHSLLRGYCTLIVDNQWSFSIFLQTTRNDLKDFLLT